MEKCEHNVKSDATATTNPHFIPHFYYYYFHCFFDIACMFNESNLSNELGTTEMSGTIAEWKTTVKTVGKLKDTMYRPADTGGRMVDEKYSDNKTGN